MLKAPNTSLTTVRPPISFNNEMLTTYPGPSISSMS